MERRTFLAGAGASLATTLAGCLGVTPGEETPGEGTPGGECRESTLNHDSESEERFLEEGASPESPGAREFLATVEEETDGLTRFRGDGDTWRIGFSEEGDTWEIKYRGTPHAGEDRFREEIAELSTAFASNRPAGVSLAATSLHECTTGTWRVCADTAGAYERGELDRKTFVDRVHGNAEVVNDC